MNGVADLDVVFGVLRSPERVDYWEDRHPDSLSDLDEKLTQSLASLENIVQCILLRSAAKTKNYIWAMDKNGSIKIAVEELAVIQRDAGYSGYPRRRGYKHLSEDKKLGHPTLLNGEKARIAGELAFDDVDDSGKLQWVLNVNSGRYCRSNPPSRTQIDNVANRFKELGLDIFTDYD